jgi:hypothetical protein
MFLSIFCGTAMAGDEVDYSAPYITLENGELVTKYPAKQHDPNAQIAGDPDPWGIAGSGILIALAVFLSRNAEGRGRVSETESAG